MVGRRPSSKWPVVARIVYRITGGIVDSCRVRYAMRPTSTLEHRSLRERLGTRCVMCPLPQKRSKRTGSFDRGYDSRSPAASYSSPCMAPDCITPPAVCPTSWTSALHPYGDDERERKKGHRVLRSLHTSNPIFKILPHERQYLPLRDAALTAADAAAARATVFLPQLYAPASGRLLATPGRDPKISPVLKLFGPWVKCYVGGSVWHAREMSKDIKMVLATFWEDFGCPSPSSYNIHQAHTPWNHSRKRQ